MLKTDSEASANAMNDLAHLASAVGHNVINAFSAIVSNAELLRIKLGPNGPPIDSSQIATMIIDTAVEAATVARRLIDFSRPITSVGEQHVSLDQLVAEFVEAGRQAESEGMIWTTDLAPVPFIRGEASHLEAMLDLLVANAREARLEPNLPVLHFATSVDARGWVVLEVRDNGRGMSPETLERAVEPFYSTKGGHLGVGLSIANGIWRRHRGTLSLESPREGGVVLKLCVEPLKL